MLYKQKSRGRPKTTSVPLLRLAEKARKMVDDKQPYITLQKYPMSILPTLTVHVGLAQDIRTDNSNDSPVGLSGDIHSANIGYDYQNHRRHGKDKLTAFQFVHGLLPFSLALFVDYESQLSTS